MKTTLAYFIITNIFDRKSMWDTHNVFYSFSVKNIFHDKMNLRLFYVHVLSYMCNMRNVLLLSHFSSPENIKKPEGFRFFQGV